MTVKLEQLATQYVLVPIITNDDLGAPADPTSYTTTMAFEATNELSASPTWYSASWQTSTQGKHFSRCKIGPLGVVALTPETWWPFVKIVTPDETVILKAKSPIRIL